MVKRHLPVSSIASVNARSTPSARSTCAPTRWRGRMEGFLVLDYAHRHGEAQAELARWVGEGKIKFRTHVVEGLERAPDALNLLFTGENTGKVILNVD
jgi:NADPH-dependent curcumin reductase CurA